MQPIQTNKINQGFSLIEIMVGLVIGLISMLIVMQVYATFEGQKRTTTSGANAETSGGLGLYTMERDIRMTGYGLNASVGCPLQTSQALPAPFSNALLMPIRIDSGAGGLPDTFTLLSSDKPNFSVPVMYVPRPPSTPPVFAPSQTLGLTSAYGIDAADMMIIYQGSNCNLFQVDSVDSTDPLNPFMYHSAGGWNGAVTGYAYTNQATLMDLGDFVGHSYSLDANDNLVLTTYSASTNTASSQIIASDIVSLQAQYGFDTRASQGTSFIVDTWSNTMIDADASGTAGDVGDIRRIYAVRFAVVARSGLKEKPQANGACNITTAFPTWASDATNPTGIAIDVSKNPDGSANPDWQCYRYKTFETVVPLRNQIW